MKISGGFLDKYSLIYADPPWAYRDKAKDGERGVRYKYQTMTVPDICRLPVWDMCADNCLLAMWWVPTQPMEALKVMEAWGFRLMTMKGFTWVKANKNKGNHAIGMGHMTRANSEDVLFAVRGKMLPRLDASICQAQIAPRGEHSAKPDLFRQLLVKLVGNVPRIELFARQAADGWDCWGNEAPEPAIIVQSGRVLTSANDNVHRLTFEQARIHTQTKFSAIIKALAD